jgi:hypothetical protein
MDIPVFANDGLQVEIAAIVVREARVESGCRLASRLANFISFERAFYDIGDRPMFTARQTGARSRALALRTESWGSAMLEILRECHSGPIS